MSNVDDIPIDPALRGAIDPALMVEGESMIVEQSHAQVPCFQTQTQPSPDEYRVRQYSQGPQGDPFAPQIVGPFFPVEHEPPVPPQKPKRKRRVRREEECSFCQGNEKRNKNGDPEPMATCDECGRSGHPSCMELAEIGHVLISYPWKCIECKNCELCKEKGDDERILFCDCCDRGWHLDCMVPPLSEPPNGRWHCPECPPPYPEGQGCELENIQPTEEVQQFQTHDREASVASSSRSALETPQIELKGGTKGKRPTLGKGKAKPKVVMVSEDDEEDSDDDAGEGAADEITTIVSRSRARPKSTKKGKARHEPIDESSEVEEMPSSPIKQQQRKRKRPRESPPPQVHLPRVRLRLPTQKGKGKEREEDEPPYGLFDDILSIDERDTTKTTINKTDKFYFERSRVAAEEKLALPQQPPPANAIPRMSDFHNLSTPGPSRPLRSSTLNQIPTMASTPIGPSASPGPSTPGGPLAKIDPALLRIRTIRFGQYDIKTWYDAPFPEEYASIPDGRLWICEFCLKYMKSRFGAGRHRMKCKARHPPGDEIYRDGAISIFEVDGRRNKIYCQNLCLLSKMFLDHKSLFYDVEPFLFYVITEVDDFGARFVGYFSKEKRSPKDYNVSCIMTLPVRQRQGWGNLLIDFSYLLSKKEQRLGSPEKPLSSLGALGYKNYWTLAVYRYLESAPEKIRLEDISSATSMTLEDVCETLIEQKMIYIREASPTIIKPSPGQSIKFPKGRKNGIARRQLQRLQTQDKDSDGLKGPFVPPKNYEIQFDREKVAQYLRNWEAKGYLRLRPDKLQWTPYLITRAPKSLEASTGEASASTSVSNLVDEIPVSNEVVQPVTVESTMIAGDGNMMDELPVFNNRLTNGKRSRTRSPVKSPTKDALQNAIKDLDLNERPASPLRRLRSRQGSSTSVSLRHSLPVEDLPQDARLPSRTSSRRISSVDSDEALAVKLALEERQSQGRQLRSRRSESRPESQRPVLLPPERTPPVPKRRKSELSVEVEEEEESSPPPMKSDEPGSVNDFHNGNHSPTVFEAETPNINGVEDGDSRDKAQITVYSPPTEAVLSAEVPISVDANLEDKRTNFMIETDLKLEDVETPFTSLTNWQSLPTGDTIFMPDHPLPLSKSLNGFTSVNGTLHMESDLRSTLATGDVKMEEEGCGEEDAEGDYDEDAEGEPDEEFLGMAA